MATIGELAPFISILSQTLQMLIAELKWTHKGSI